MELDSLRLQTQTLLHQLYSRQSAVKRQLNTLSLRSACRDGASRIRTQPALHNDVRITTASLVDFADNTTVTDASSASANIYRCKKYDDWDHHPVGAANNTTLDSSAQSYGSSANLTLEGANLRRATAREEAMQSILKRRKIIDDNVKVGPPQHHHATDGQRNLNFDYNDVDDIDMLKKVVRNQLQIDMALEDSLASGAAEVDELDRRRRLLDSGNDRRHAAIIQELSARPKSIVFDETAPQGREKFGTSMRSMSTVASHRGRVHPLLGYDFIAGLLDNESQLVDRSDAYYDELNEFRRVNAEECVGKARIESVLDLTRPISPGIKDPGHTCIHGYNINTRLYPEPLNENEDGQSVCPVCLTTRQTPTQEEPSYVRVSIPRSTLHAPYRVKPHRRRSFDDTDNFALSKHCLAGWECSKPSMLPTASTVDLMQATDGLRAKLATVVNCDTSSHGLELNRPSPPCW